MADSLQPLLSRHTLNSLLINPRPLPRRVQLTPAPEVDPEKQRRFEWHPDYGYDRPDDDAAG